ncbi:uncharacterized protein B0I36DRAFT_364160 [Microdochium trichocladiopsis]|uniref:Uncharacterized protein n=1 Tax=Microdochium trichocladiopsis TaxID=1682393 RepID=A0A9P9BMI5_9PEZI|nr:uncharacterized protein B0I36DRAFT_364160 [Microdochium trichocladiopsis]KAH7029648.1 hypothetical protein B0I36DRAFT_364160 [Microdochium trichocladiopsis]
MARHGYLAQTVFRLLRDSFDQHRQQQQLVYGAYSSSVHHFFSEVTNLEAGDGGRHAVISRHSKSEYPINIFSLAADLEVSRIKHRVAASAGLSLDDGIPVWTKTAASAPVVHGAERSSAGS